MQSVTLILDKRRELSTKYKKLLENSHNAVIITKDLISAMKIIQDKEPDLIIISDSIKGDLAEDCKKIRALTYNMRPIIVGLSKSGELDDKLKALENGADDYISEPVSSEEFVMRMKAHLRREYESNLDIKKLLPNKNYSIRALKRITTQNTSWACLLISIENFNNYKETYTELASDKLTQTYAAIIRSTLSEQDYIGGLADNEFLVITDRLKAEKIANFLTFAFDSVVSKFYSAQDNKRGYMLMRGDEFAGRRSNFVYTIIGIVTNEFTLYNDPVQLMNSLINIHNMAKSNNYSNYLIERPQITAEDSVQTSAYNKNILIIEDDEAMSLLLTTILNLQGYNVNVINKYSDISDKKLNPAVIIIDAGDLETLTGVELSKAIRKNDRLNRTKIIVTSAYHDKELVLSSGADLYMPKPYEPSLIIKWVEQFVNEFNN